MATPTGRWNEIRDVRDTLSANLAGRDDVGASVAVILEQRPIIEIWGGRNTTRRHVAWERDTIINVYSTTKTMAALCALVLTE